MKLKFTEEEKKSISDIISSYEFVSKKMNSLKKESDRIEKEAEECSKKLDELQAEEKELLANLRSKYGKFSLQDISDTLYGGK